MPTAEIATDLLTPLGAYLKLREGAAGAFLLESVERGRLGNHSFVGRGSRLVTFDEAEALGEPVVGYLGYDGVSRLEPTVSLPAAARHGREQFRRGRVLVRFDHARGIAEVLLGDPARSTVAPQPELPRGNGARGELRRYPSREEHLDRVEMAKEHIREGDVFQVVIAQRAERPTSASAAELYRALRRVNPSPYLFLLEFGDLALVGSSPETVVKCEGARAALNPIAGTIAPGEGDAEALLSSEKDRAEHVMLVDLGRNDLSRVCMPGSVHVEKFMEPERYSHVTHLVSEVIGELRDDVSPFGLLRACFPAGTVSGAPKVRAMQIISELEQYRRGIYAARSATSSRRSALDTCIAIRTLVLHDGVAYLQAGGGIVADSDPAAEHEECLNKLAALEQAIDLAESVILLIDNYDSFTYNLAHLFGALGAEVTVRRNDEIDADEAERLQPAQLVISPGPGRPADAGASKAIVERLAATTPTLGVCLGHQAIVEVFGGEVGYARELLHGKACPSVTTDAACSPMCPRRSMPAATTRSPRRACRTCSSRRRSRTTARSWPCGIAASRRRRAVPSRVGADAGRADARAEFPRGLL